MWYVNGNKMDTWLPATSKKPAENYVNWLQGSIWSEADFNLRPRSLVQQGRVYHFARHILTAPQSRLPLTEIYIHKGQSQSNDSYFLFHTSLCTSWIMKFS